MLAAVGGAALPARTMAAGEEEWQLSARLGAADFAVDGRTPWGGMGGLDLQYGFTDAVAARVSTTVSYHPVDAQPDIALPGGTVRGMSTLVGITYTFDVLRLVPYADLGVGFINVAGAVTTSGSALATELGVGADYLLTTRWAVGGALKYQFTPFELINFPGTFGGTPFLFSVAVRLSRIF